jgi:hypothetical protein
MAPDSTIRTLPSLNGLSALVDAVNPAGGGLNAVHIGP